MDAASKMWAGCDDKVLLRKFFDCPSDSYEKSNLSFSGSYNYSDEFLEVARDVYKRSPDKVHTSLISIINLKFSNSDQISLTKIQKKKLEKAKKFLKSIGFDASPYKIITVDSLGECILAMAVKSEQKIIISKKVFDQGLKQLVSTLLEEIIHLREGLRDKTYDMQTYLFDLILTMAEEATGEVL